jgi:hypothetical protein
LYFASCASSRFNFTLASTTNIAEFGARTQLALKIWFDLTSSTIFGEYLFVGANWASLVAFKASSMVAQPCYDVYFLPPQYNTTMSDPRYALQKPSSFGHA